jgi:hypothetical protein
MNLSERTALMPGIAPRPAIWLGGFRFSEPVALRFVEAPHRGGVYAILKRSVFSPGQFRVIDIGETHDCWGRVNKDHERFDKWCKAANGLERVYVAFHLMPGATKDERLEIEDRLTKAYQPVCSGTLTLKKRIDAFGRTEAQPKLFSRPARMAMAFSSSKKKERFGF